MALTSTGNPRDKSLRSKLAEVMQANARLEADNAILHSHLKEARRKCEAQEVEIKQLRDHVKYAEAKHGKQ